ncbi:hypothetical protein [Pseudomonas coronafaciens]|uniref:hypothetical protein n=1 Tax=Pseudomonas coronafaciens TaxID=53409 RepID=UPI000EFF493D|nr:hypothetical protein [Pseudomonas coronafaciens]
MSEDTYKWSSDDFLRAFVNGWVVDGRAGGLIRGRLHSEGHVVMLQPSSTTLGEYELLGLVEGGEYVMSPDASEAHYHRIEEINSDMTPHPAAPGRKSERTLDVRAEPHDKFLIIQKGQWIVNIQATNRHFEELDALNNSFGFCSGRVLTDAQISELMSTEFD